MKGVLSSQAAGGSSMDIRPDGHDSSLHQPMISLSILEIRMISLGECLRGGR